MNTLVDSCKCQFLKGKYVLVALVAGAAMVGQSSFADLIIRGGATVNVSNAAILDVNCTDISIESGGTLNLSSASIENVLNFNQAIGGIFNNTGGTVSDCLPQFSKRFSPESIVSGGVSTLTYTIENPSSTAATAISFSDNLDEIAPLNEVVIANPSNASTTCTSGVVTAPAGSVNISLSSAELAANDVCTVSIDVTSSVVGTHPSTSSELSSSSGINDPASAQLVVREAVSGMPPAFFTGFVGDPVIGPGAVTTLRYTIDNTFSSDPATDLAFTNVLPASVVIATPANIVTDCNPGFNGTITAPGGGTTVSLNGYEIGAASACTISVDVTSSTIGLHTNPAVTLSSSNGASISTTVDITVSADRPGFSKSFAPSSVNAGGRSTLTFSIDNASNASALSLVSFQDHFPAGMVIADPANASTSCLAPLGLELSAEPGTDLFSVEAQGVGFGGLEVLAAGASCIASVDVIASRAGELVNISDDLVVRVGSAFSNISVGKASDTLDVLRTDLAISKSFIDDPTPPGSTSTLEFTITNFDRNFAATDIAFSDDLTAFVPVLPGLTFDSVLSNSCGGDLTGVGNGLIGFTGGTLPAQQTCTIQVSLSVPIGVAPGAYSGTTSPVSGMVDGSAVVGNAASETLFAEPVPQITKTFINDPVNPGGSVVLEFTVTNTSPTSSATDITFEDVFEVVLPTASQTPGNDCVGNGSTCTFVPLFNPPPNCDPCDATPARLNVSGGSLAPAGMPGDSATFQITLDVSPDAASGRYENSTSRITATVDGATRTGQPASDAFDVVGAPSLSKVFVDDPVAPGGTVTLEYSLRHSAEASGDATGITFTDDLATVPAGLTVNLPPIPNPPCGPGSALLGSAGDTLITLSGAMLSPGQDCTFNVTLDVSANADSGTYSNPTSDVSAVVDGLPVTSIAASADLVVSSFMFTKEFIGDPVIAGETATLRYTLENMDAVNDATAISFTENLTAVLPGVPDLVLLTALPASYCGGTLSAIGSSFLIFSGGVLAAGDPACSINLDLMVPVGTSDGIYSSGSGNLTALLDGAATVFEPANGVLIVDSERLLLSKEFVDDQAVLPGNVASVLFTIANTDPTRSASNIAFTDSLGSIIPGLTIEELQPASDCQSAGATIFGIASATFGVSDLTLAPGASCTVLGNMRIPENAAAGTYTNTTSSVTGTINGLPVTGAAATDEFTVVDQDISFTKEFDSAPVQAGDTTALSFTITNNGDTAVTSISFSDDLDAVLPGLVANDLPVNDVCGVGSVLSGTSLLALTGANLAASGGSCTFGVEVAIPQGITPGVYPNTTSDLTVLGQVVTLPATADLTVSPTPPVFSKSFVPDTVNDNATTSLRFNIDNTVSPVAASALDFTDVLPVGLVVASVTNIANTCSGGTLTAVPGAAVISYTGGTVNAAASCVIQVDVSAPATGGVFTNTTGDLTSALGNSGTATANLTVIDDLDGDTIVNAVDNCPNTSNTDQADLDGDGLGNVCDSDADGDQMSNTFEIRNGLNPFNSFDQQGDPDGDGFSNLQEFRFNTDPNAANSDDNNNGIPDIVDMRRMAIPPIITPLLLDAIP